MRSRFAVIAPAVLSMLPANAAAGRPARNIEKLAGGADRFAALADGSVTFFDRDGERLGGCAEIGASPAAPERRPIVALDADEALALAGLPDDDDSTDAEDALADEGIASARPRLRPPPGVPVVRDVAADSFGRSFWIATSEGLLREIGNRCSRAGLAGHDLLLTSAGQSTVAAATDNVLWRIDSSTSLMTIAGGLPYRPRALAVDADGSIFVADDWGLLEAAPGQGIARVFDHPAEALAFCEGELLALAEDGVYAGRRAEMVRVGERPPVRWLTCGPSGGPRFLAAGFGLWASGDGATWVELGGVSRQSTSEPSDGFRTSRDGLAWAKPTLPQRESVGALAAVGERVWVALDGEIVVVDHLEPRPPLAAAPTAVVTAATGLFPRVRTGRSTFPWPRLTVALGAAETRYRVSWSALLLVSFPLGRKVAGGLPPAALAAGLSKRDAALAAESTLLRSLAPDQETAARAQMLEQEGAALR